MLGREMERQVPRSAFDVSAIMAAPKFLCGPMKIFCTEPTAPAAVQRIPGKDGLKEGDLACTTPKRTVHFKAMLYQLTTSPQHYRWEMTTGIFSLLYPTSSLWRTNGRHCCIWAALRFVRKGLVCSSPKAQTQQGWDELLGTAGMNRGQVLQDILTCLGSLT